MRETVDKNRLGGHCRRMYDHNIDGEKVGGMHKEFVFVF